MKEKICMSCMNMVPDGALSCPACGYDGSQKNPEICLYIGKRLGSRYVVGKLLESDGDTAVYAGYDVQLARRIEIREFLPVGGCFRNKETGRLLPKTGAELHYKTSLMDFCDLYKNLKKLTYEEGIVRTLDFFEDNQTAYAVLEIFESVTLKEFLSLKNGMVTYEQCSAILQPVFNALNSIHSVHLTHRGVSPDTILVSRTGEVKLSGFATTSVRTKGTDFASRLFPGYSAPEQYSTTTWQSAATDVYGLAATIYRCVTGTVPQDSDQRRMYDNLMPPASLNSTVPLWVSNALMMAMLVDQQTRTQTILGFRQTLSDSALRPAVPSGYEEEEPAEETSYEQYPAAMPRDDRPARDSSRAAPRALKIIAIISASFFVLMIAVYFLLIAIKSSTSGNPVDDIPDFSDYLVVPNYIGKTLDEADGNFDVYNFVFEIETIFSEGDPEGMIVGTSPPPNSTAKKGDTIIIYINMTKVVKMESFIGLTIENAEMLLKELGIGKNNYEMLSEESTLGYNFTVYKQSVEPGEEFNVNTDMITLTIAINDEQEVIEEEDLE